MSSSLRLSVHDLPEEYAEAVQGYLSRDEAEYGLLLGLLRMLSSAPPPARPFMARILDGTVTVGTAYFSDKLLVISRGPSEAWPLVAERLLQEGRSPPCLVGPAREAAEMAQAWSRLRGCAAKLMTDQRLYKLTEVTHPAGVPGHAGLAGDGQAPLLADWLERFALDAVPWERHERAKIIEDAGRRIAARLPYFWIVDGKPVALASLARPSDRGITVNAVYTPPEHRGRGYASALVAEISAEGLRRGKEFCVLYADTANARSNAIYQRVGYRHICDSRVYSFGY